MVFESVIKFTLNQINQIFNILCIMQIDGFQCHHYYLNCQKAESGQFIHI